MSRCVQRQLKLCLQQTAVQTWLMLIFAYGVFTRQVHTPDGSYTDTRLCHYVNVTYYCKLAQSDIVMLIGMMCMHSIQYQGEWH